jgi:hypothetical protein
MARAFATGACREAALTGSRALLLQVAQARKQHAAKEKAFAAKMFG